jgi:uncharacterized protein (TIGR03083 family)
MTGPTRSVASLDKFDVLSGLFASWDGIGRLVDGLSDARWQTSTPLPGWCVYDVVAHIIGTESMLGGAATPGSDVDVATLGHVRNGVGEMNECWIRHLRGGSGADLLTRFRAVTGQRRKVLDAMTEANWTAPAMTPAGQATYSRFMRIRVFDCWMHDQDIREALGRPSTDEDLDTVAARLALDEMTATMGFVVGKRGKAPDGSRVAIELTGPMARTIRVAVDGRAAVVDDFGDRGPTTTIRLDGLQFTRICGGRPLTAARSTAIEISGDTEVGDRIVEHLNYVM